MKIRNNIFVISIIILNNLIQLRNINCQNLKFKFNKKIILRNNFFQPIPIIVHDKILILDYKNKQIKSISTYSSKLKFKSSIKIHEPIYNIKFPFVHMQTDNGFLIQGLIHDRKNKNQIWPQNVFIINDKGKIIKNKIFYDFFIIILPKHQFKDANFWGIGGEDYSQNNIDLTSEFLLNMNDNLIEIKKEKINKAISIYYLRWITPNNIHLIQ